MPTDEELAKIGYEAERAAKADRMDTDPSTFSGWEDLTTIAMIDKTAFATAIRKALQSETEEEREERRFLEAIIIAFHQMKVGSAEEAAAWYTLRDWLRLQYRDREAGDAVSS